MITDANIRIFYEEGMWLAASLDYDILVASESLEKLLPRFMLTLMLESIENGGLKKFGE